MIHTLLDYIPTPVKWALGAFFSLFGLIAIYYYLTIYTDLDRLINYKPNLTTQFIDCNGKLVANVFEGENRMYVPYEELPPRLVESLVATEDTSFFEHEGVSFESIFRALVKDIIAGKAVEGASTLTQQLIKTTVLSSEKTMSRKLKEAFIAYRVENLLTKPQIMERYLNQIYFGHGFYGVKTAAYGYFHKELKSLTLKEIAILVGLPKAPTYYDPIKNPDMSFARANSILYRLHSLGWIDDASLKSGLEEKPPIFNDPLALNNAPYAVESAVKMLQAEFPDLKKGGYVVQLTLDLNLQKAAEESLIHQYNTIVQATPGKNVTLNGALLSMDQTNGDILAWVGGVDYKKSPFNRIVQSKRQVGSSFKPFVYLSALSNGFSDGSTLNDSPKEYTFNVGNGKKVWTPKNYGGDFSGPVSLREALVHSKNLATIDLVEQLGMDRLISKLTSYGIQNVQRNLSIALGSMGMSPYELAEYYTIISNYGTKVKPNLIKSVKPPVGPTIVYHSKKDNIEDPSTVYRLISIMQDVVRRGTGTTASVNGLEVAGKTGTTNDSRDAWFCGFSPTIQTIIWFGNDDNSPLSGRYTGGVACGPVFSAYYNKILAHRPNIKRNFTIPFSNTQTAIEGNATENNSSNSENNSSTP